VRDIDSPLSKCCASKLQWSLCSPEHVSFSYISTRISLINKAFEVLAHSEGARQSTKSLKAKAKAKAGQIALQAMYKAK